MVATGCKTLDDLIGDQLPQKIITQVYGPAGSGKTNVCLQTLYLCTKAGKKAVFIDSDCSFSVKRLSQICGNSLEKVLKNTYLFEVNNFKEQNEAIAAIGKLHDFGIIIIDSMTSLYRLETNDSTFHDTCRELGRQLSMLLRYAKEREIPILITNQVYANLDSGKVEPIGGDVLKYYSKIIIELQKETDGTRKATLKKHFFRKDGEETRFKIIEKGIQ